MINISKKEIYGTPKFDFEERQTPFKPGGQSRKTFPFFCNYLIKRPYQTKIICIESAFRVLFDDLIFKDILQIEIGINQ
jgi:hypothetical protein